MDSATLLNIIAIASIALVALTIAIMVLDNK